MTEEKKPTKAVCKKCGAEYATAGQLKRVAEKLGFVEYGRKRYVITAHRDARGGQE